MRQHKKTRSAADRLNLLEDHLWLLLDALLGVLKGAELRYKHVAAELRVLLGDNSRGSVQLLREAVVRYRTALEAKPGESFERDFDETVVLVGHGQVYVRRTLAKATAEQDGSAHESKAVDQSLLVAREASTGGRSYLIQELVTAGRLALTWGIKVLRVAERVDGYQRKRDWSQQDVDWVMQARPRAASTHGPLFEARAAGLEKVGSLGGWVSMNAMIASQNMLFNVGDDRSSASVELTAEGRLTAEVSLGAQTMRASMLDSVTDRQLGEWNLLVVNWDFDGSSLTISLNGAEVARKD